jgi:hypothetical protein
MKLPKNLKRIELFITNDGLLNKKNRLNRLKTLAKQVLYMFLGEAYDI